MVRLGALALGLLLAAVAIWHPAPRAPAASLAPSALVQHHPRGREPRAARLAPPLVVVYVVGAVVHPGLYRLPASARIDDAVRRAGGLLGGADPAGVDLAAHLADGDEVDVPRIGERVVHRGAAGRPPAHSRIRRRKRGGAPVAPIDLNAADARALATIPGIGPAIAQRIVALREREGAYTSFDELLDVAGVSSARLDRARPYLVLRESP